MIRVFFLILTLFGILFAFPAPDYEGVDSYSPYSTGYTQETHYGGAVEEDLCHNAQCLPSPDNGGLCHEVFNGGCCPTWECVHEDGEVSQHSGMGFGHMDERSLTTTTFHGHSDLLPPHVPHLDINTCGNVHCGPEPEGRGECMPTISDPEACCPAWECVTLDGIVSHVSGVSMSSGSGIVGSSSHSSSYTYTSSISGRKK